MGIGLLLLLAILFLLIWVKTYILAPIAGRPVHLLLIAALIFVVIDAIKRRKRSL
jgi:Family of unknown function (DUF5670)